MKAESTHALQDPTPAAVSLYLESLKPYWHPVMTSEALREGPELTVLLGRQLAVARLEGRPVAFDDICRHMGGALSRGQVLNSRRLQCRYHGWTYDKTGRCVDIPGRRDAPIPRDARVQTYNCIEAYGLVWVCLEKEPRLPLPDFPELSDKRFRVIAPRAHIPWAASVTRMVMAALDDSHFPWVHPGILGDPSRPEPPDHRAWVTDDVLISTYAMMQPTGNTALAGGDTTLALEKVTYTNYATPNSIRLVKANPDGIYVLWNAFQPVNYNYSIPYTTILRDYETDPSEDQRYIDFNLLVKEQDKFVVEGQRPWLLPPLSSRLMLYVRPADLPIVAFQKWMEELGIPQI